MPVSGGGSEDIEFDGPPVYARDQDGSYNYSSGPGIHNDFQIVEGICILPIAEAPPTLPGELADWSPVAVMRLHSPYRIRRSSFAAVKQTRPPVLPSPGTEGKFEFVGGSLSFATTPNGDAFDWLCGTEYVYVENCVSRTIDGFVLGTFPFQFPSQKQSEMHGGSPLVSSPGAIADAGGDARRGWAEQANGPNAYTAMSFFPGIFFNAELNNGGLGSSPYQFTTTFPGVG